MSDVFDRLKTALADRYAIEREIGSGGMATVYLAEDVKLHREEDGSTLVSISARIRSSSP
jgi:serine/threonine protein kinase